MIMTALLSIMHMYITILDKIETEVYLTRHDRLYT